ncbi:MAG: SDR family NAD(P)-dependent oxidoreductase [bacterium]|nr:SDR family NAD(P)-dependent oxidoreductase [bacterium]
MAGKVWFITGTSSGFGWELCKEVAKNNDFVVATARKPETLKPLVNQFKDRVIAVKLDVTNKKQVKDAVHAALKWKGRIDVLVNNAGVGHIGAVEEASDEEYHYLFNTNVFGVVNVMKAVLPHMRRRKQGHILNVSSLSAFHIYPGLGVYSATKSSLESISEAVAIETRQLGIRVTIVEPGAFKTKFGGKNIAKSKTIKDYKKPIGLLKNYIHHMEKIAPGDPKKAAKAMIKVVYMKHPPIRLPLGNDALDDLLPKMDKLKKQMLENEELSRSTDIDKHVFSDLFHKAVKKMRNFHKSKHNY